MDVVGIGHSRYLMIFSNAVSMWPVYCLHPRKKTLLSMPDGADNVWIFNVVG